MNATELLVWGTVAHLVADWFLQNDWQAVTKVKLENFGAHVHCWCHWFCLALVFPFWMAALLAVIHMLIDTRVPLVWWRKVLGQAKEGNPFADHVKMWQDQAAHVLCIAVAAIIIGR